MPMDLLQIIDNAEQVPLDIDLAFGSEGESVQVEN